jgi:acyl-CoA thioesterase FadM
MNLWLRLIWLLATAHRRNTLEVPGGLAALRFRVWPHDLDLSLHMNNGRYLGIMDLGRLDVIVRMGLWRAVLRHRWTPIANAALIRFRRELRLFERYRLETRILAWDQLAVVLEQVFRFDGGPRDGEVAARALFKGGLYDRGQRQFVPIARLMSEVGASAQSPPSSPEVEAFLKADDAIRQSGSSPAA